MEKNTSFSWEKAIRIGAGLSAIYLWVMSMNYSADGFGISVSDDEKALLGWGLAIVFTVLQLVWNRMLGKAGNLTIYVFGILVYIYSIVTDVVGLSFAFKHTEVMSLKSLIIGLLAFMMEVVPEPLMIWAITSSFTVGGDFLGNLLGDNANAASVARQPQRREPRNIRIPAELNRRKPDTRPVGGSGSQSIHPWTETRPSPRNLHLTPRGNGDFFSRVDNDDED